VDHQRRFRHNRSTSHQIFCIRQMLEKNWTLHQLFIDVKKTFDPARKEVIYNFLTENNIPMDRIYVNYLCLNDI